MAKVCIICANEGSGSPVADDFVIRAIRSVKKATGTAKNNELVVCGGCLERYTKKRADYEKKIAIYLVLAAAVFAILTVLPIMTTGFSLYSIFMGVALGVFLMLLPVLTSHTPRLAAGAAMADNSSAKSARKRKAAGRKKR